MTRLQKKTGIEGFRNYIEEVATVGNWAGNLEIAALATTLDRPILVLHEYGQIYIFNPEGSKPDLYLYYQTCGRYESLQVSKETALTLRTKAAAGRTPGGRQSRGSLGGNTASSVLGGCARKTQSQFTKSPRTALSYAMTKEKSLGGLTKNQKDTIASTGSKDAGSSTDRLSNVSWECSACGQIITAHSLVQLNKKKNGHLESNAGCLKGLIEKETWTCPWCDITVRATDRCKLSKKRAKHHSYYHPERDGSKSDTLAVRYPPVETSNLPLGQRNWTCPFCLEGLPLLGKAAHDKAVTHHYKTRHKRRKITKKTVAQTRYKQYKTNPELHPKLVQGKQSLGRKLIENAAKRREADVKGHHLVEIPLNKSTWPMKLNKSRTVFTCTKCRAIKKSGNWSNDCSGAPVALPVFIDRWKKFGDDNRNILCKLWGISLSEANTWIDSAVAAWKQKDADHLGHDFRSIKVDWSKWPIQNARNHGPVVTCVKCKITRRRVSPKTLTKCRGTKSKPHQGQIVFWKSLDGNHYLKNLLTKTWGCSVKEANQWFARTDTTKPTPRSKVWKRKLVEDGDIESQPGPDSLDIITLNAGGSLATWQALKVLLNETHFDVVQLQDVRLTTKYWSALFRTASSKGYVGYHGPGTYTKDRWQNSIPRGGVATFVAKKCKSKLISHAHKEHSQLLCVAVQGLLLFNGYAPPGHEDLPQDELAEMFVDLFQGHGLTEVQPWVISGDFNEKPHDGNLSNLFEAYAGHYFGIGNPTRWDGSREVDWYSTNRPQSVLQVDSCDLHFSDHIPLRLRLQLHFEETLQGTLQKFVDYSIPVDLSHNHWQVILENAWASVDSVRNLFDLLQNDDIDVQKEWDEFPACLNDVFCNAFEQVLEGNFPITSKKDVLKRTKKGIPKGDIASHKWVPWNRKRGYLDTGSIKLKQLRNRLTRLCVLRKCVRENASHEIRLRSTLKKKLGLAHCDMISLCQEISSVQTEITTAWLNMIVRINCDNGNFQ